MSTDVDHDGPPEGFAGFAVETEQRLTTLEEGLAAVLEEMDSTLPPVTYSWQRATAEDAKRLWRDLAVFVHWLDARYLRHLAVDALRLPECWWRHPVAVEELTALMAAYEQAYFTRQRSRGSSEPAEWHLRYFWPTLQRMSGELKLWKDCERAHHGPQRDGWSPGADFRAHVGEDVARRAAAEAEEHNEGGRAT